MGFVSGLFSGDKGANFQGTSANLQTPLNSGQAMQAYDQNSSALAQQAQFLQALQAQNGVQNQSDVYNQMQAVANGTGPNPAQAMLAQATGNNNAAQAALMAGQRGAGANVGLIARQAGQQGAANQQNAAGQGATLQANQSLNALNNAGNIANTQVGNEANAANSYQAGTANRQANAFNQINAQNNAQLGNQTNLNNVNAGIAQGNQAFQAGLTNKGIGAVGQVFGAAGLMAEGGEVMDMGMHPAIQHFADVAPGSAPIDFGSASSKAAPVIAQMFADDAKKKQGGGGAPKSGGIGGVSEDEAMGSVGAQAGMGGIGGLGATDLMAAAPAAAMVAARGGKVPALVSPGEVYLNPGKAKAAAEGKANPMKAGEKIPGKPKVEGAVNSYANDTVPKQLEEGGIVIPRSITQGKNSEEKAMAFVRAVMAHSNFKKGRK